MAGLDEQLKTMLAMMAASGYGESELDAFVRESAAAAVDAANSTGWRFVNACKMGDIATAKCMYERHRLMYEHHRSDGDVDAQVSVALQSACRHGHLEVAKWLLSVQPAIDTSADSPEVKSRFTLACLGGHLDVAKWLLELTPNLDVIFTADYVHQCTCTNGALELDVALWLQSLKLERSRLELA